MTRLFEKDERARVAAALDRQVPGSSALGGVEYVERLLTALEHDPPRLWAAPGPWSGGDGTGWLPVGPWERQAWEHRLGEWRAVYQRVIDGVATPDDERVVHAHACEATYGDPAYGGNRASHGWQQVHFPEPLFPPARSEPT